MLAAFSKVITKQDTPHYALYSSNKKSELYKNMTLNKYWTVKSKCREVKEDTKNIQFLLEDASIIHKNIFVGVTHFSSFCPIGVAFPSKTLTPTH